MRKKAEKNLYKDDVGDLRDLDKIDELLRYEKLIEEGKEIDLFRLRKGTETLKNSWFAQKNQEEVMICRIFKVINNTAY